jgi:hypothetical protein
MDWITGLATDPTASDEDRELSDADISFMMNHQDACTNPEHQQPQWRTKLEGLDKRLASRFSEAFADLVRQERGELTQSSPHEWILEALREVGAEITNVVELIGRPFVFTYNLDADIDRLMAEQCGVVSGTIVGAVANTFLQEDSEVEILTLTTCELRVNIYRENQLHLTRVVGLQVSSADSAVTAENKTWRLVLTYPDRIPGYYQGITGTLRILPK